MRFGKQAAVQEHDAVEHEPAFLRTRQQLLGDGVAIVVGEHVHAADAVLREQRLAQIGLLGNRIRTPRRGFSEHPKPSRSSGVQRIACGRAHPTRP
jgi:hypothetical protein